MTWVVSSIFKISRRQWIYGITTDNNGILYFTSGDDGLWMVNTTQNLITQLVKDRTFHMRGIVFDEISNALYICNWGHSILVYDLNTQKLSNLTKNSSGCIDGRLEYSAFCYPSGITIDNKRNLYITECNKLRMINLKNNMVSTIAGNSTGLHSRSRLSPIDQSFSFPRHVAWSEDFIYVADGSLVRCVANGGTMYSLNIQCTDAHGVLLDEQGNIFIAEHSGLYKIRKDSSKEVILQFPDLRNVAMDKKGRLFVGSREIIMLQKSWCLERWLWIGKLKENSATCHLTNLPKDLIYEITMYLRCTNFTL